MSEKKNGGPAFPLAHSHIDLEHTNWATANGMTLRDYFAATAGVTWSDAVDLLTKSGGTATGPEVAQMLAHMRYQVAEEMLRIGGGE